jgi:hypothetical protein
LTIVRDNVGVTMSASPNPVGVDQPMTFTATVVPAPPGAGAPTGTVQFFDGAILLGSATLAGGSASLTTAGLDPGTRAIEARYPGDGSFNAGSGFSTQIVNDSSATPKVALSSSRNPADFGVAVTLTATVTFLSGAPSARVDFYDGGAWIGSATLSSAGTATFTTSALEIGSHAITARYAGAGDVPPSRSPVFVQTTSGSGAKPKPSTTALSSAPNPSPLGTAVDLSVDVIGSARAMPSGRVLFMVDGAVVGDASGEPVAPLSGSTARATLRLPALMHGRHIIAATYLGDSSYKGSTAAVTQTVN